MQYKSIFQPSPLAPGVIFKIVPDMSPFIAGRQEGPGVPGEGAVSLTIWKESIWGEYSHFFPLFVRNT